MGTVVDVYIAIFGRLYKCYPCKQLKEEALRTDFSSWLRNKIWAWKGLVTCEKQLGVGNKARGGGLEACQHTCLCFLHASMQ